MSNKRPQSTKVLALRLRRVAKRLERYLVEDWQGTSDEPQWRARANTCWQAAARLELLTDPHAERCEGCTNTATTADDAGVPLCDDCYAGLER